MGNTTNSDKTGFIAYDGTTTINGRTLTAGTGISITNGNGVSGNPTINASADSANTFTADSGSATPATNNLDLLGSSAIQTSGSGDTVTIAVDNTQVVTSYAADAGTATPAAGVINFQGGTNVTTSASGSTVTFNISGGSGGGWVLLETQSASSTSFIEFSSFSSTYKSYIFLVHDLLFDANATLYLQLSSDGGTTWDSGGGDYKYAARETDQIGGAAVSSYASFSSGAINLTNNTILSGSNRTFSAEVKLYCPANSSFSRVSFHNNYTFSSTGGGMIFGTGLKAAASSINALRFGSLANITSGTIKMYGLTAS